MNTITSIFWFLSGIAAGICLFVFKYISLSKDNAAKEQKIHDLMEHIENLSKDNAAKEQKINNLMEHIENLSKDNAAKEQKIHDLMEHIENQTHLNNNLKIEFENIASKVLEAKNAKIADLNRISLGNVVSPLNETNNELKGKLGEMVKMVSGLQGQLGIMVQSTKQVSEDANSLANALKGNNSFHGKWGEHSLERMLEIAGMTKGVDYELQKRFNDGEDKPDCVINLPDGKHIVIDVKTSFVAYEKYYNPQNETDKKIHLKEHFASIKNHIDKLIKKNYVSLPGTNQPDYVVMFVPLDGAVSLAIEYEQDIIGYALRNNIVIATPLTLLSMLKTIQYIWRQENQKKNVIEIAELAGYIHDKYAELFQSLQSVDKKISEAQVKTQDAIKKLSTADKKGESIIKRLQKMKSLGVPTKKEIPEDLLKTVE